MIEYGAVAVPRREVEWKGTRIGLESRAIGFTAWGNQFAAGARYTAPTFVEVVSPRGARVAIEDPMMTARLFVLTLLFMASIWRLLSGRN